MSIRVIIQQQKELNWRTHDHSYSHAPNCDVHCCWHPLMTIHLGWTAASGAWSVDRTRAVSCHDHHFRFPGWQLKFHIVIFSFQVLNFGQHWSARYILWQMDNTQQTTQTPQPPPTTQNKEKYDLKENHAIVPTPWTVTNNTTQKMQHRQNYLGRDASKSRFCTAVWSWCSHTRIAHALLENSHNRICILLQAMPWCCTWPSCHDRSASASFSEWLKYDPYSIIPRFAGK